VIAFDQIALFVALYALGLSLVLAFGPRTRTALCCALAFPSGLALYVLAATFLVLSPVPYTRASAVALFAILAVPSAVAATRRWRPTRAAVTTVLAWSAGFAAFVVWLHGFDASRLSHDSSAIVHTGLRLAELEGARHALLSTKGSFHIVVHSLAYFTSDAYLWAIAPAIAGGLAALFVVLGVEGLRALGACRPRSIALVVLAVVVLMTTYMVSFHAFYIHSNSGGALYALAFVGLWWLSELDGSTDALPVAALLLVAFVAQRNEGPVFGAILILTCVVPSALPRRALDRFVAGYCAIVAAIYLLLEGAPHFHFTEGRRRMTLALTLATGVAWLIASRTPLARLRRVVPQLAVGGMLVLGVVAYLASASMRNSIDVMYGNTIAQRRTGQMWGSVWTVVAASFALTALLPGVRRASAFAWSAVGTLLLILLIALMHPYRMSPHDSGNRMLLQVIPLALFYLTLKAAVVLGRPPDVSVSSRAAS
jgi:hypothetical protein